MPITITCRRCGGRNVARDAWAEWSDERQEWVLGDVFDAATCFDCDAETSLDEAPLVGRLE